MAYLGVTEARAATRASISELDRRRSAACSVRAATGPHHNGRDQPVIGRQEVETSAEAPAASRHCHAAFGADDRLFGEPAARYRQLAMRWPSVKPSTPSPTASMRPTISPPGMKGKGGCTW